MHAPEIENPILAGLPLVLLHVTTEASMAVIRNVDSSTSSPLTIELFVTVAVAVIIPSIILFTTVPIIFADNNSSKSPCPMYSALLQPRTKTDKFDGALIVQVKMTSSPGQAV